MGCFFVHPNEKTTHYYIRHGSKLAVPALLFRDVWRDVVPPRKDLFWLWQRGRAARARKDFCGAASLPCRPLASFTVEENLSLLRAFRFSPTVKLIAAKRNL